MAFVALALAGAALFAVAAGQRPAPTVTPAPVVLAPATVPVFATYDENGTAIDLVAVSRDGGTSVWRHLDPSQPGIGDAAIIGGQPVRFGSLLGISTDGWLAVELAINDQERWALAFIDLPHPDAAPLVIAQHGSATDGTWGPAHVFARLLDDGALEFIDVDSGAIVRRGRPQLLSGSLVWTADGSGVVGWPTNNDDPYAPGTLAVIGPELTNPIASLPAVLDRHIDRAGTIAGVCPARGGFRNQHACDGVSGVITESSDFRILGWSPDELDAQTPYEAMFSAVDDALWVATHPADGSPAAPVAIWRLDGPDRARLVSSLDVTLLGAGENNPGAFRIGGIAPDDSVVVTQEHLVDGYVTVVLPLDGSAGVIVRGQGPFIGFVESALISGQ